MRSKTIYLYQSGEYTYPMAFGFVPNLRVFLHEDDTVRPFVIVVPGGAYRYCSPSEAEPVRNHFYGMGFQTGILTYTTNPVLNAPLGTQASKDLARAVRAVRQMAADFCADPSRVAVCGFSAGGHLCADVSVHFSDYGGRGVRPDAAVLGYPVITLGKLTHSGTRTALLGQDPDQADVIHFSEEKQVGADTPPTFVWTTATDELVPPENTMLYAQALAAAGVPYSMHIFSQGQHGLSAADAHWASGSFGNYTLDQGRRVREQVRAGAVPDIPQDEMLTYLDDFIDEDRSEREPNPEVETWTSMAEVFLRQQGF